MGSIFSSKKNLVHLPPNPVVLQASQQSLSLSTLVQNHCKTLFLDFKPAWWLFNGHLQTTYCVWGDFTKVDRLFYNRHYIRLEDGGTLGLDFAPADPQGVRDDAPIIVILHGLTGGSHESYIRCILHPACAPASEGGLGYRGVVINLRGCAGVPMTSQQFYSAGHTGDVRAALAYIRNYYPEATLLGLGFSLGANILTRYIAEEGEQSRLAAGCVLGCPWNLALNNDALNSTFIGKHLYAKGLGTNLLKLIKKHLAPLSKDPQHPVTKAFSDALQLKNPTLELFDSTFTRIAGGPSPEFPFPSVRDYYEKMSSHKVLEDVKVPFLAVNSADDPVVRDVPLDGAGNEYVVMVLTPIGGHLGWFEADRGFRVKRWIVKPVLEWLHLVGDVLVHDMSHECPLYRDARGFLKEAGRDTLGCRVIEGGGIIDAIQGQSGLWQGL